MPTFYTIEVDGTVTSEERSAPPKYEELRTRIGASVVERVNVLFADKAATMFVDENGTLISDWKVNRKASAVYANVTLWRGGISTYDDLSQEHGVSEVTVSGRPLVIAGRALLWTGSVPL